MKKKPKMYDFYKTDFSIMCKSDNMQEKTGKRGRFLEKVARFLPDFLEKKNKKNINNAHNILRKKVWGDTMRI